MAAAACAVASGCATIRSDLFSTDACSDTKKAKHLTGVPTTIDVPTHIKLAVVEKRYFIKNGGDWKRSPVPPSKDVIFDLVTMKELYTVDLKRPASGTIKYDLTFLEDDKKNPAQRLKQIKSNITDTTIQDTAKLIQTIIATTPTLARLGAIKLSSDQDKPAATPPDEKHTATFVELPGLIACDLFELRDPLLSERMRDFLETHLNGCHACPFPYAGPAGKRNCR
ncbi:MAG: hypothetical protein FJ303_10170 [Planctomycetes bacterium]|nr:hypothetical protein [Planctomycetota bacterium]